MRVTPCSEYRVPFFTFVFGNFPPSWQTNLPTSLKKGNPGDDDVYIYVCIYKYCLFFVWNITRNSYRKRDFALEISIEKLKRSSYFSCYFRGRTELNISH